MKAKLINALIGTLIVLGMLGILVLGGIIDSL